MSDASETNEVKQRLLSDDVQAHLGRSSKLGGTQVTRDWGLYSFFRIHPQAEFEANHKRMKVVVEAAASDAAISKLVQAIYDATCANAGIGLDTCPKDPKLAAEAIAKTLKEAKQPAPAKAFRNWLGALIGAGVRPLQEKLALELRSSLAEINNSIVAETKAIFNHLIEARAKGQKLEDALAPLIKPHTADGKRPPGPTPMETAVLHVVLASYAALVNKESFENLLLYFGDTPRTAGLKALSGGLLTTFFYEFLRQLAPAHGKGVAVLHPESASRQASGAAWDSTPVTCAFTFSGLNALQVDSVTLNSFPEPFKEGMAARAERLGDTGPCAPEHWDGVLGLKSVHGYFMGGHLRGDGKLPEAWRAGLRDDIRAFNDGTGIGPVLRAFLGAFTMPLGFEVMHIELGEDPYDVEEIEKTKLSAPRPYRLEHFGFRDGVSQPFVNMGLQDTLPGGGRPSRNRTWTPVAPGEIFLDNNDDDDNRHVLPLNSTLRRGSTFLVFRKLEQDVARFRIFLAQQRPGDEKAQGKLAAQIVGRWPNGTSLVTSSEAELNLGDDHEGRLNDFLYAADDPEGLKCPLSSHVRRANPRDIGGTDEVRRHRILRRGMAYGGPLLPKDSLGDGYKRGLLFICANSRIDLQFEVIQADWLNGGELLGQAGLNRCPLTGANSGRLTDAFLEAGAVAPVTGLPRFVITRGGDYFFAPGLPALKELAVERDVYFEDEKNRHIGASMGRSRTPGLFTPERIKSLLPRLLYQDRVIRYQLKQPKPAAPKAGGTPEGGQDTTVADAKPTDLETKPEVITFLGRHADVKEVLSISKTDAGGVKTSVAHYHEALVRLSRGEDMLVSTEPGVLTGAKRERMQELLETAWKLLKDKNRGLYPWMKDVLDKNLEKALRRCGPGKRIDLVHDLATVSTYSLIEGVFGTPGPKWLTELGPSLQFSQAHVGALQPDWLQSLAGKGVDQPELRTMQIWSILLFLDIVGNYERRGEAAALSEQAGSEFLTHLNGLLGKAREKQKHSLPKLSNLLEVFVFLEKQMLSKYGDSVEEYYTDVRMLLLELAGATLANIPATFGAVMETIFKYNINLTDLVAFLQAPEGKPIGNAGIVRLIYEATRITSPMQILMRRVAETHTLSSGVELQKDEMLAALIAVANFDREGISGAFPFLLGSVSGRPEARTRELPAVRVAGWRQSARPVVLWPGVRALRHCRVRQGSRPTPGLAEGGGQGGRSGPAALHHDRAAGAVQERIGRWGGASNRSATRP